jgi:ribosome-binding factor A
MPQGSRPDRVGDQIRSELGQLLTRDVRDPGIGFVTLTRVQVTPDLQRARIYYTALGDERARRSSQKALERATPFLRRQIGSRLRLRRTPELEFVFDESIAGQDRIERLLAEIHATEIGAQPEDSSQLGSNPPGAPHDNDADDDADDEPDDKA